MECFYKVNDDIYLLIQECDSGWDYTFWLASTGEEIDGGQIDDASMDANAAVAIAAEICEIEIDSVLPIEDYEDILEDLA